MLVGRQTAIFITLVAGASTFATGKTPGQQTPVFRSGIELTQLDVSVYDKSHRPIVGLKVDDFVLMEDRKPISIATLAEVNTPSEPASTTPWLRDAGSDIATNEVRDRQLFVILVDDASLGAYGNPVAIERMIARTREIAESFIQRLGTSDLATVIFTGDNRRSQEFTNDHARLKAAVEHIGAPGMDLCLQAMYSVDVLRRIADVLVKVPGRRKVLVDITSARLTRGGVQRGCYSQAWTQTEVLLEAAQRANVSVFTIAPHRMELKPLDRETEWAQVVANETGGEALAAGGTDPSNIEAAVARVFDASRSYYMLGYVSANPKTSHLMKVSVKKRPDLEVVTRERRYSPPAPDVSRQNAALPTVNAMARVLPDDGLLMRLNVSPFADPTSRGKGLLAITTQIPPGGPDAWAGPLDLRSALFTAEGTPIQSINETVRIASGATSTGDVCVVSGLTAPKPGLYEVRVSLHLATGQAGSVYQTVDVPDFDRLPLSLSGLEISVGTGSAIGRGAALSSVLPIAPTIRRTFSRSEEPVVFFYLYEAHDSPIVPVVLQMSILDAHGDAVVNTSSSVGAERFSDHSAEVRLPLPVRNLSSAKFLLALTASAGKNTAKRELRFKVE